MLPSPNDLWNLGSTVRRASGDRNTSGVASCAKVVVDSHGAYYLESTNLTLPQGKIKAHETIDDSQDAGWHKLNDKNVTYAKRAPRSQYRISSLFGSAHGKLQRSISTLLYILNVLLA